MKSMLLRRFFVLVSIVVMAASLLLPSYAVAQGRGHGRGLAKKRLKFINGHDARAGRWDGRGPRPRLGVGTYRGRGRHRGWMIRKHKRVREFHVR
jgi:hypothetical protein